MASDNLTIKSLVSDKDIVFQGNDGGSGITALRLDMSNAGNAIFNYGGEFHASVHLDSDSAQLQLGDDNDMQVYHNGAHGTIRHITKNPHLDYARSVIEMDGVNEDMFRGKMLYGAFAKEKFNSYETAPGKEVFDYQSPKLNLMGITKIKKPLMRFSSIIVSMDFHTINLPSKRK